MFQSTKQKLLLGMYIFLILSVPVGAYLVSQQHILKSSAQSPEDRSLTQPVTSPIPTTNSNNFSQPNPSPSPSANSPVSFGPVLNLSLVLEGRPKNNQAAKVFVGIAQGILTLNPKYLLSFSIDIPESGKFSGLSLAGLTAGTKYTAYIKGPSQIATSSAFIMSPSSTDLNSSSPINLTTGDLNEDNVIDQSDYTIAQGLFNTTTSSSNWNSNADFNLDGVINSLDLGIISKNLNKTGAGGIWRSTPVASQSASPTGGYWFWMPKL